MSVLLLLTCLAGVRAGPVTVEDVTARQLEAALDTENTLAVLFCKSDPQSNPASIWLSTNYRSF